MSDMPHLFTDPTSLILWFITATIGPVLTYLAFHRQQRSKEMQQESKGYHNIVQDAMTLKTDFQRDYEALRKRVTEQESQIALLRQRVLLLEEENHQLRVHMIATGVALPPSPIATPAPPSRRRKPSQSQGHTSRPRKNTLIEE